MWGRYLLLISCLIAISAAAAPSTRPSPCKVGTTYKKDCNTCTCSADNKDKCSQIDCSREKNKNVTPTPRTPTGQRPGICPTKVTPAPGSNSCSTRTQSNCKIDTDCPAAKKCCQDGCQRFLCRNAIYPNTP